MNFFRKRKSFAVCLLFFVATLFCVYLSGSHKIIIYKVSQYILSSNDKDALQSFYRSFSESQKGRSILLHNYAISVADVEDFGLWAYRYSPSRPIVDNPLSTEEMDDIYRIIISRALPSHQKVILLDLWKGCELSEKDYSALKKAIPLLSQKDASDKVISAALEVYMKARNGLSELPKDDAFLLEVVNDLSLDYLPDDARKKLYTIIKSAPSYEKTTKPEKPTEPDL